MHTSVRIFLAGLATLALARAETPFDAYLPATAKTVLFGTVTPTTPPAVRIKSGQTVKIDTLNSTELNQEDYSAVLKRGGVPLDAPFHRETLDLLGRATTPTARSSRLLTGPVFIEEAQPGDTLEVRVLDVTVQSDYAINRTMTNMGHPLASITPAPIARVYKLDRTGKKVLFNANIEIPIWAYLGEMGISPAEDAGTYSANRPSKLYGGSFDSPDLGKGATLYFPVQAPGALFVAGAGKAAGANGKVNYFGLEVPATAYLQFIVHKGKTIASVRAETPTHYLTFGTADVLDVVMRLSALELVDFLKERAGLDFFFSYSLGCLAVDFNITRANTMGQVMAAVTPKYIFIEKSPAYWYQGELAPKYYLPGNYFHPQKELMSFQQFLPPPAKTAGL